MSRVRVVGRGLSEWGDVKTHSHGGNCAKRSFLRARRCFRRAPQSLRRTTRSFLASLSSCSHLHAVMLLHARYVSTVSGPGADTDRIHCIWAEIQLVQYVLYLIVSEVEAVFTIDTLYRACRSRTAPTASVRSSGTLARLVTYVMLCYVMLTPPYLPGSVGMAVRCQ